MPDKTASPERRLELFPITTRVVSGAKQTELTIAGYKLTELANQYSTPLYLYDQTTLDTCLESYFSSLSRFYPASSGVTYDCFTCN